jgi:hypothetical protein
MVSLRFGAAWLDVCSKWKEYAVAATARESEE